MTFKSNVGGKNCIINALCNSILHPTVYVYYEILSQKFTKHSIFITTHHSRLQF